MAGRGQVSWLPGWSAAPSRELCVSPSGRRKRACGFLRPVTVAGPRRFLTGLPLTTDRIYGRVYPAQTHLGESDNRLRSQRITLPLHIRAKFPRSLEGMEAMRQSWTDDCLDDLSRRMDERFDHVDTEIRELRTEMNENSRRLQDEIGAVQRTMIQVGGGLIAGVLGLMAAVIGLVATQL
jgi:hypothetical protein